MEFKQTLLLIKIERDNYQIIVKYIRIIKLKSRHNLMIIAAFCYPNTGSPVQQILLHYALKIPNNVYNNYVVYTSE